jgi:5'-nucleotidase
MSRLRVLVALLALLALIAASCGDDDADDAASTSSSDVEAEATETETSETVAPEPLDILVTNDDGVDAPGIDVLVTALLELPDVTVTVVAPAENQSGTSMNLTEGDLDSADTTTAGGYDAVAVEGFPADTVAWALANLDTEFDLVASGSNSGQNIGTLSLLSGTVGAARYAAQNDIPAVAVSQGAGEVEDFPASVGTAIDWITEHRADYEAGEVSLFSVNAPSCPDGPRDVLEVPLANDLQGRDPFTTDCASTETDPVDDVDAFIYGFTAITELPITV